MNGAPPPLVSPGDASLMYQYDPYGLAAATTGGAQSPLLEYHPGLEQSAVGTSWVR